jgi:hypothetical protein
MRTPNAVSLRTLLTLSAVAACGGKTAGTNDCSIVLDGAQTGTFKCGPQDSPDQGPLVEYDSTKDRTTVDIAFNAPGDTPDFQSELGFSGKPAVGTTYTFASSGATGSGSVQHGSLLWSCASMAPVTGSVSVTFTTLGGASATTWATMHGKIIAVMPTASGGATGCVTATATF